MQATEMMELQQMMEKKSNLHRPNAAAATGARLSAETERTYWT